MTWEKSLSRAAQWRKASILAIKSYALIYTKTELLVKLLTVLRQTLFILISRTWLSKTARMNRKKLWRLRMSRCVRCQLFNHSLKTCGTAGETYFNNQTMKSEPLGCWCWLPLATQDPEKDCWGRANGLDIGWPDDIRP